VLFAVDGRRTSGEIFRMLKLTEEEGAEILERLRDYELIREKALNYKEYIAAQTQAEVAPEEARPQTLAEFLFGGSLLAQAAAAAGGRKTPPPPPEEVAVVEPSHQTPPPQPPPASPGSAPRPESRPDADPDAPADPATPQPASSQRPAFQPLQAPPKQSTPSRNPQNSEPMPATLDSRRLSLKNVIDFIIQNASDVNAGQLDVYRVFIRVNTQLLKRNGIHSLRFTDDRVISDPELQEAILQSVDRTLGLACPDHVFI
jgi:hypothetical protein